MLINLVINAVHAMNRPGTISLRLSSEERARRPSGGDWVIEVEDQGAGIAPEHLGKIFEPFFTTKRVGEGIGLGLSIAFGIVREHGGSIEVESVLGKGSTFRVRLPRGPLDAAEADVVVTDLNMPGQSGIQFCEWVVTNRSDTPVIVITAFGSLETAIAAIRAGAYDFITKPFEIDVLAIALERAIRHRELRHEVKRLRTLLDATRGMSELLGESPVMQELKELMARVAPSHAAVRLHRRDRRHAWRTCR